MIEFIYQIIVKIHVVCGLAALPIFWLPALTRKGSPLHRKSGRWFLVLMSVVVLTGIPMTISFLMDDRWVAGTFLGFLLVITTTALTTAWYSLKLKQQPERYFGGAYRLGGIINLVAGGSVLYLGLANDILLLTIFSVIGLLGGVDMLKKLRRDPEPKWWLEEHLGGMIGGGIAAHVAFGAFGLRQLWPQYGAFDGFIGMLPWMLPPIIGIAATIYSMRKYQTRSS